MGQHCRKQCEKLPRRLVVVLNASTLHDNDCVNVEISHVEFNKFCRLLTAAVVTFRHGKKVNGENLCYALICADVSVNQPYPERLLHVLKNEKIPTATQGACAFIYHSYSYILLRMNVFTWLFFTPKLYSKFTLAQSAH